MSDNIPPTWALRLALAEDRDYAGDADYDTFVECQYCSGWFLLPEGATEPTCNECAGEIAHMQAERQARAS